MASVGSKRTGNDGTRTFDSLSPLMLLRDDLGRGRSGGIGSCVRLSCEQLPDRSDG
jgi:hypothetical protein